MILFILSAMVAGLSTIFNAAMVNAYMREYDERARVFVEKSGAGLPHGLSTTVIRSWLSRVADVSTNFPAVVLTFVAFSEIEPFATHELATALLIFASTCFVLATALTDGPKRAEPWGIRVKVRKMELALSVWTILLIALNLSGLGLVSFFPEVKQ